MTRNENRLFGRHFEAVQIFYIFFPEIWLWLVYIYTYGVTIIKKFRWESGFLWGGSMEPPLCTNGSAGYLMQLSVKVWHKKNNMYYVIGKRLNNMFFLIKSFCLFIVFVFKKKYEYFYPYSVTQSFFFFFFFFLIFSLLYKKGWNTKNFIKISREIFLCCFVIVSQMCIKSLVRPCNKR